MSFWSRRKKPDQTFMLEPVKETPKEESDPSGRPPERDDNPEHPRLIAMKNYEEMKRFHEQSIIDQRKKVEHDRRESV